MLDAYDLCIKHRIMFGGNICNSFLSEENVFSYSLVSDMLPEIYVE